MEEVIRECNTINKNNTTIFIDLILQRGRYAVYGVHGIYNAYAIYHEE